MENNRAEHFTLGLLASLFAGGVIWLFTRPRILSLQQMVNPNRVSFLAFQMPQDEQEFIHSALGWVHNNIAYQSLASDIHFRDSTVLCQDCSIPAETLTKGQGNCLSQAVLLTSLLRNRLPSTRVYTAIGDVAVNGLGGHSWVVVQEESSWFIADPTSGLWAPETHPKYAAYAAFNDEFVKCLPGHEICVAGGNVVLTCLPCQRV